MVETSLGEVEEVVEAVEAVEAVEVVGTAVAAMAVRMTVTLGGEVKGRRTEEKEGEEGGG